MSHMLPSSTETIPQPPSRSYHDYPTTFVQPFQSTGAPAPPYAKSKSTDDFRPRAESQSTPSRSLSYDCPPPQRVYSQAPYTFHRNIVPTTVYRDDSRRHHYSSANLPLNHSTYPALDSRPPYPPSTRNSGLPPTISTSVGASRGGAAEDDEQTPVARHRSQPLVFPRVVQQPEASMGMANSGASSSSNASKYECGYCGKGFSRPSSLKVSRHFLLHFAVLTKSPSFRST